MSELCPIGLDETPEICSAGTCSVCVTARLIYTQARLDTAMRLLRDNQSPMHFDREMSQADHDILREARKWR